MVDQPVVDFDVLLSVVVEVEAHEVQVEDGREVGEDDPLVRVLQPVGARVVLVVSVHGLNRHVLLE